MSIKEKTQKQASKQKKESFIEVEDFQAKIDAAERNLQESNEASQVQIAERKQIEKAFEEAEKYTSDIAETIRGPLIVLSAGLKVISANRYFYETFHVTPAETEGRSIFD
ncbi:MAG TPA: hypothetical protein ENN23_10370, partial [Deltaproteobacteria bacterium]|nr:hypothetical protein [Deltaproteobacteria bacterium]